MPRYDGQGTVVDAILGGITQAQKTYEEWAKGEWLAYACEYLITVHIAQSIMKLRGPKYLTVEHNCGDAMQRSCGGRKTRLPKAMRANGRFDIMLTWADNTPRTVIEVKNNVYNYKTQCDSDIRRIVSMLKKPESSLRFGVFAFYTSADDGKRKPAKTRLADRMEKIAVCARENCAGFTVTLRRTGIHEKDGGAWAAACLVFRLQ